MTDKKISECGEHYVHLNVSSIPGVPMPPQSPPGTPNAYNINMEPILRGLIITKSFDKGTITLSDGTSMSIKEFEKTRSAGWCRIKKSS